MYLYLARLYYEYEYDIFSTVGISGTVFLFEINLMGIYLKIDFKLPVS